MNTMISNFRATALSSDLRALINALPPTTTATALPVVEVTESARCHVCSGALEPSSTFQSVVEFAEAQGLPAHLGCHHVRLGAAPPTIAFAMKMGFWAMMLIQHEKYAKWLPDFAAAWVDTFGAKAGTIVATSNIPEWDATGTIDSDDELVDFLRCLFIFEREQPKFEFQGKSVPPIDPYLTWKEYKRDRFMPAYATLERLTDRKTLLAAEEILARTGGACAFCYGDIPREKDAGDLGLAKDHIHPFSKGGTDDLSNLQPLHHFCNGAITSLGPGEIPLSISMGRFIIDTAAGADESKEPTWLEPMLITYSKHLADSRKRSAKRKNQS